MLGHFIVLYDRLYLLLVGCGMVRSASLTSTVSDTGLQTKKSGAACLASRLLVNLGSPNGSVFGQIVSP
jgi:hypothetical protein